MFLSLSVSEVKKPELTTDEKCERTFVTFTDESTFKDIFPQKYVLFLISICSGLKLKKKKKKSW